MPLIRCGINLQTLNKKAMVRLKFLFLISLLTLITSCSTNDITEEVFITEVSVSSMEQEVIDVVNDYRVSQGLNALEFNNVVYDFANTHNAYMIAEGKISHDDFDIRSSNLSVQANADFVSENLGKDFTNANDILEAWIASPTHKKVMEGQFTQTAVSVQADANGVLYYTQLFIK